MAEDFVEKVKFVKQKSEWEYAEDGGGEVMLFFKDMKFNSYSCLRLRPVTGYRDNNLVILR